MLEIWGGLASVMVLTSPEMLAVLATELGSELAPRLGSESVLMVDL